MGSGISDSVVEARGVARQDVVSGGVSQMGAGGMNKRFKVVGRYVYPMLESTKTFRTYDEALAELKRWKKEAASQHQEMFGRVIDLKNR